MVHAIECMTVNRDLCRAEYLLPPNPIQMEMLQLNIKHKISCDIMQTEQLTAGLEEMICQLNRNEFVSLLRSLHR